MSGNNGGSTVAQSQNEFVTCENASRIQRRAKARQHTEREHALIPDETSVEADVSAFFGEDGSLISADEAQDVEVSGGCDPSEIDAEEFLAEVAPERLSDIEQKAEALPGSRDELVEYHARKVLNEAEERGDALHVEAGGGELLSLTVHQDERGEKVSEVLRRLDEESDEEAADEDTLDECPKCGAEHVTADTVEMQTRAADESGTQITKTSCGCTFRRTD